jgi:hydrogenase maturation protein HypF
MMKNITLNKCNNGTGPAETIRRYIRLAGQVQGVGFRPFVYRLANELNLKGQVRNGTQGVEIDIEGATAAIDNFIRRLDDDKPVQASIETKNIKALNPVGYSEFKVSESTNANRKTAGVLPDMATCPECLAEIFDPDNRRFRYPFTNCTNCGPRYSIIETLPYDRDNTTMRAFPMCDDCRAEYEDPADRRFHAQPNACPVCGPHLELWDHAGKIMGLHDAALTAACDIIRDGRILALKGLGGFQLLVDARNDKAVERLRARKARQEKPLALMYPNIESIRDACEVSTIEQEVLLSYQAPIVLLKNKRLKANRSFKIAASAAPGNPYSGIMLPYTPLHYLLMRELGFPIVATSGNYSEEPICIDEYEALERLGDIADFFLIHNRPIARQVDDSVVTVMDNQPVVLRNARGYAPASIYLNRTLPATLAVGAHLKNSIAISNGHKIILSQHIGDLVTRQAHDAFARTIDSLSGIYDFQPEYVAADRHPDYLSSRYAEQIAGHHKTVQHHYAHVLACMADNKLQKTVLGVAWDGTGLGMDGTIWGGEFLVADQHSFTRAAHLKYFRLPGGEKAVREPRRAALGLLYEIYGDRLFNSRNIEPLRTFAPAELKILRDMLQRKVNSPATSSAGRLFDGVSSLLGFKHVNNFEGQAAMMLEYAAMETNISKCYEFDIDSGSRPYVIDWRPIIEGILSDMEKGINKNIIAARFHNTLTEMIVQTASLIGEKDIVLTGGCFQNKYLTELTIKKLQKSGFNVNWHNNIPPNDGGIAVGQILAGHRRENKDK